MPSTGPTISGARNVPRPGRRPISVATVISVPATIQTTNGTARPVRVLMAGDEHVHRAGSEPGPQRDRSTGRDERGTDDQEADPSGQRRGATDPVDREEGRDRAARTVRRRVDLLADMGGARCGSDSGGRVSIATPRSKDEGRRCDVGHRHRPASPRVSPACQGAGVRGRCGRRPSGAS